ncbi:MAG: amidohydrolase family protein, partial [Chloroflexota bacterium]|nr:amidohydrolase family protein [Chloroflexota bacterium]
MSALLLRGGWVIDGTGGDRVRGDVAVRDGRIAAVGPDLPTDGARVIDATGMVVCPGFIDIHSHSDESVLVNSALESAVHQGVTLVVAGNCGGSSAPALGLAAEELEREMARLDLERTWTSFGEYADT